MNEIVIFLCVIALRVRSLLATYRSLFGIPCLLMCLKISRYKTGCAISELKKMEYQVNTFKLIIEINTVEQSVLLDTLLAKVDKPMIQTIKRKHKI